MKSADRSGFHHRTDLEQAADLFVRASGKLALTGAGISVESGIPDFRSPGGLWTVFQPEEYATLEVFVRDPAKAWRLYRAVGRTLQDARPNAAHEALARLERTDLLEGIVTQNIDRLHQAAGSRTVAEIHGHHDELHCLWCGRTVPLSPAHYEEETPIPRCPACDKPLKPAIVLFGEGVRDLDRIGVMINRCRALLVVGTAAEVYPAAGIPETITQRGGLLIEFNLEPTHLTQHSPACGAGSEGGSGGADSPESFFFQGPATETLTAFADLVIERAGRCR